ncbi:CRISPR-associated RAMP protein, Cmr6 family [Thermodesulfatator indicus DSM 15286]|uniref:CRISPR-associated RAMP protein, Cmr6 family n=1 Tax=Thermodesulfatator indicus (strain DSM 15286 / JCM 11887 / CIR29812) TaxID=667014 RepID=F8A971_THEID|nr:type III-B CRISPR module RAMP protein Cmr6 [Thermodesulfatator indicus]AEH45207.1 CRISPR-associated RAMP protein, Cmr6 family [Thermodesulfatator indicus DSM 15286]
MPDWGKKPKHGEQGRKRKQSIPKYFSPLSADHVGIIQNLGDSFNFGLYFNKWLFTEWKTRNNFKFPEYQFQASGQAKIVLNYYEKASKGVKSLIAKKQKEIENICKAFQMLGYERVSKTYTLQTSLIIGLGNAHPTERGFTFHWTLGIPYLPAESIKGVVRLAYLVNKAQEEPDFFEHWAEEDERFWEYLAKPFGREEKDGKRARRGKVIFFDALPVEPPQLTLEITTCHYSDYYGGKRGPTEDQNPNPLPFLAVATGAKFRFVLLMHESLGDKAKEKLLKAFHAALAEHGFGAKTALGHGRFVYGS